MSKIIFTDVVGVPVEYYPQPASKLIPDWYKESTSYISEKKPNGFGKTTANIKRCMPIFDSLNSGYYLVTHTDIWIDQETEIKNSDDPLSQEIINVPTYQWPSLYALQFHPHIQAEFHPKATGNPIPKWMNPWSIKTPKGYSTLFIPPMNRDNPLVAFPAIVDTDMYTPPVNIIFTLSDPGFKGLIPAGTPIVQVMPFKRESWQMEFGDKKEIEEASAIQRKLHSVFFDSYKNHFRQNKEYK